MNGYVDGGYLVTLGTIGSYALVLLRRERIARRRLEAGERELDAEPSPSSSGRQS